MDNTGKTTLVEEVAKLFNHAAEEQVVDQIKSPGPIDWAMQRKWVDRELKPYFGNLRIYDRFPLFEEVVYGKTLRGKSCFSIEDQYFARLKKVAPMIVYTRPAKETILNFGERAQMDGVIENAEKLLAAYDELMFRLLTTGWKILPYDFQKNSAEAVAEAFMIMDTIEQIQGGKQ